MAFMQMRHPTHLTPLTYDPGDKAEDNGDGDEGPVPGVRPVHGGHAQEDEDQGLADGAPHLQEVLDGGVGLVGDVGLHVGPHDRAARYQPAGGGRGYGVRTAL